MYVNKHHHIRFITGLDQYSLCIYIELSNNYIDILGMVDCSFKYCLFIITIIELIVYTTFTILFVNKNGKL